MKYETRIVEFNNNGLKTNLIRIIKDVLYQPILNQKILVLYDGKRLECLVVGVSDSVYDDIIYRYVEVAIT